MTGYNWGNPDGSTSSTICRFSDVLMVIIPVMTEIWINTEC